MDLATHIPTWAEIERNLNHKFSDFHHTLNHGLSSASSGLHASWNGISQRLEHGASHVYAELGGQRIDAVRQAMQRSYPLIHHDLSQRWASINIDEILDVLLGLVKQVALILGGSVTLGSIAGGVAGGVLGGGVGAAPGAVAGAGVGLEIGNLILLGLGLSAIAEYFYTGLPACLETLQNGIVTAWRVDNKASGSRLEAGGGHASTRQARIDQAARQLARGQEQLVMLLLTAIVTYLTRGQLKGALTSSAEGIAARSAVLQQQISERRLADWLARNEQKLLAERSLQPRTSAPVQQAEEPIRLRPKAEQAKPVDPVEPPGEPVKATQSRREYLNQRYKRTGDLNRDINIRANRQLAANFFKEQGYNAKQTASYMNGLDFNYPVEVQTFNSSKNLWQYQSPGAPQGNWYSLSPTVQPTQLGISPMGTNRALNTIEPKVLNSYQTADKVTVLRSTSAKVNDTWSVEGQSFPTEGGAQQLFSNQKNLFNPGSP
ncbi:polymorphic toxin type 46 domain-containing protein [Pseudomonas sp. TE3610]